MSATSTLDDSQFLASVRELSQVAGVEYKHLLHNQAGAVIKILAKDKSAKPPSRKKIAEQVTRKVMPHFKGRAGEIAIDRTHQTFFRQPGGQWRMVFDAGPSRGWRLRADEWAAYKAVVEERRRFIAAEVARRYARAGLLRMSFIQIADNLGVNLSQVSGGALSEKIPRRAKMPGMLGHAHKAAQGKAYDMVLSNFSNGVRGKQLGYWQRKLQTAITKRARAIEIDMRKGVFKDMELRVKRYPGVFVEP